MLLSRTQLSLIWYACCVYTGQTYKCKLSVPFVKSNVPLGSVLCVTHAQTSHAGGMLHEYYIYTNPQSSEPYNISLVKFTMKCLVSCKLIIIISYNIESAWEEIQWHALRQVTIACCSVHSNGTGAGSDQLYLACAGPEPL